MRSTITKPFALFLFCLCIAGCAPAPLPAIPPMDGWYDDPKQHDTYSLAKTKAFVQTLVAANLDGIADITQTAGMLFIDLEAGADRYALHARISQLVPADAYLFPTPAASIEAALLSQLSLGHQQGKHPTKRLRRNG